MEHSQELLAELYTLGGLTLDVFLALGHLEGTPLCVGLMQKQESPGGKAQEEPFEEHGAPLLSAA